MCDLLIRLSKELQLFKSDQPEAGVVDFGPDMESTDADPFTWFAKLQGPKGSPYEGGTFLLEIKIPDDYPNRPPKVEFKTPIFHPNVQNGKICLELLEPENWNKNYKIETVVMAILQMMDENRAEGGFEEVSKLMLRDRPKWFAEAKKMTEEHAMGNAPKMI